MRENSRCVYELTGSPLKANELVVIEPTHALDVAPSARLMAEIALVHSRIGLPSYRRRHHRGVAHNMAGWRLMALRTLAGTRRWMVAFQDIYLMPDQIELGFRPDPLPDKHLPSSGTG